MPPKPEHSLEEKMRLAQCISDLYADGDNTIAECCEKFEVSPRVFSKWCKDIAEVAEIYEEAKKECRTARDKKLIENSYKGLGKLILGFDDEETTEVLEPEYDEEGKLKKYKQLSITKKKKKKAPHPTAIIFALKALQSEKFKEGKKDDGADEGPQTFTIGGKEVKF